MSLVKDLLRQKLLENSLIDEDYDVQKEMQNLTNDVYKKICSRLVDKVFYNGDTNFVPPTIIDAFEGLQPRYNKLNEFVRNFRLRVGISPTLDSKGTYNRNWGDAGTIFIKMDWQQITDILNSVVVPHLGEEDTQELRKELNSDVYFKTYSNSVISTLLHEIQHAYDSWRSKDKYIKSKRARNHFEKTADVSPKDWDDSTGLNYLKQQHEINARFAQAIDKTSFFRHNFGDDKTLSYGQKIMLEWPEVLKDFKISFLGWQLMTPNDQKRLINRVGKMYLQVKDKIEKEGY